VEPLTVSRIESDREDLMAEAVALMPRAEWLQGDGETLTVGRFRDGRLTVFLGADPVYQFDPDGRLRRAFVDGCLYRTQGTTLARIERRRGDNETVLARHDLSPQNVRHFLSEMRSHISAAWKRASSVPPTRCESGEESNDEAVGRLLRQLRMTAECDELAPRIRGKK